MKNIFKQPNKGIRLDKISKEKVSFIEYWGKIAKIGGYSVDLVLNKVDWSDEAAAIHKMPERFSTSKDEIVSTFVPECRDRFIRVFSGCEEKGISFDEEMEMTTATGSRVWVRILGEAVKDKTGKIVKIQGALQDINEQKCKEEALKQSEEKFRNLFEHCPVGNSMTNIDGSLQVNSTFCNILGYTAEELIRKTWIDITYSDDVQKILDFIQSLLEKSIEKARIEIRFINKNGSIIWADVCSYLQLDKEGNPQFLITAINDITDQKHHELINEARVHLSKFALSHSLDDLLEETLNETEKLTDSQIGFYHFVDDDEKFLTLHNWSTRTKEMLCKVERENLEEPIEKAGIWADCIRKRKPIIHNDYDSLDNRKRMPEGHAKVIRELVVPIIRGEKVRAVLGIGNKPSNYTDQDIKIVSLIADLAYEIAERKLGEVELQEAEIKYRIVADNTYDWEFWQTPDGNFKYHSPSCSRITGYSHIELYNNPDIILNMVHPEDRDIFLQHRLVENSDKIPSGIEFRIITADGKTKWISHLCQPVFDNNGIFLGTRGDNRDVTNQKKVEMQLKKYTEELNLQNKAKDKFFSILAHDLRGLFNVLLGYSEFLHDDIDNLSMNTIKTYTNSIYEATKNTFSLFSNLLEWSRMQMGNTKYNPEYFNIGDMVREIIILNSPSAQSKNIKLEFPVEAQFTVFADENMIKTILRNLISNAIKFSYMDGTITLKISSDENYTEITISDSGTGIQEEDMNKLFKIDSNFTTKGTSEEKGTGIGLALCKELVEKCHGKIWVESEVGKGSKFIFTIPIKEQIMNE